MLVIPAAMGSLKFEDHIPGRSREKMKPYLKKNHSKKGWRNG
jgi:hypothetical protein